jgi:protein-tyrosine phosphatase
MIDLHNHLLPGVDDGARTWDETLAMCRIAHEDGIRTIVATPHFQESNPGMLAPRDEVIRLVEELRARLAKESLPLEIFPGNEIRAHPRMDTFIESGQAATYGDAGHYLLLELPNQEISLNALKEMIFRVTLKGITPIVAHPERNLMLRKAPDMLPLLVQHGALAQVTAMELVNRKDRETRELSLRWIRRHVVHFLASDAHNAEQRKPLLREAFEVLRDEVEEELFDALYRRNPAAVLSGEAVEVPPLDVDEASLEESRPRSSLFQLFRRGA